MPEDRPYADFEERVALMRRLGVTKWGDIELGPVPLSTEARDDDETQRSMTPTVTEMQRRQERRRLALAASGGPVPAVERL